MSDEKDKIKIFVAGILSWHKENTLKFPWRETEDPYKVLTAEILLKKTTRDQVNKIFNQLIEKYPTVADLAGAERSELEKIIEPLGMQVKRSQALIIIAEEIVKKYYGKVPLKKDELEKIKGIGPYTANAVLTMVSNSPLPLVDTNVVRVITRVFGLTSKKARPRDDKEIWNFVEDLLPRDNAKDFNISLLDFANLICTAKNPKCPRCLLNAVCDYKNKTLL